jgi:hypothetical protein
MLTLVQLVHPQMGTFSRPWVWKKTGYSSIPTLFLTRSPSRLKVKTLSMRSTSSKVNQSSRQVKKSTVATMFRRVTICRVYPPCLRYYHYRLKLGYTKREHSVNRKEYMSNRGVRIKSIELILGMAQDIMRSLPLRWALCQGRLRAMETIDFWDTSESWIAKTTIYTSSIKREHLPRETKVIVQWLIKLMVMVPTYKWIDWFRMSSTVHH